MCFYLSPATTLLGEQIQRLWRSTKKSYKTFQMARWVLYFCHVIVYCLIWYNELESFIKWPVNMLNRWNSWFQLILGRRALMWKVAAVSFVLIWQRQQRAGFNLVAVLVWTTQNLSFSWRGSIVRPSLTIIQRTNSEVNGWLDFAVVPLDGQNLYVF